MGKIYVYLLREWRPWFVVVLVLIFPFFFIGGSNSNDPRSLKEAWNLGHFFYFAMLVFVLDSYWCATRRTILFRVLATFLTLVVVGLGIELIQLNIASRSFSLTDVLRDISGGTAALLWKTGRRLPRMQSVLCGLVAIILVLLNFVSLGGALADEYRSYKDFPLLSGFESKEELARWESGRAGLILATSPRLQGQYSAKITLTTDQYSGLSLKYFQGNWSGRSGLAFNVFNPGQQITLHYRVHDQFHRGNNQTYADRYNGTTVLEHGWNEIVIPMADIINGPRNRKMDITKITGFGIFVMNQLEPRVLYLDNVRLL